MSHFIFDILAEVIEWTAGYVMGKLGSWTARLVSFGRWDLDEESWPAIILGWCVFLAVGGAVSVWRWHQ